MLRAGEVARFAASIGRCRPCPAPLRMPHLLRPLLCLALAAGGALAAPAQPAPWPPGPTVDDHAGVAVPDPYRALERADDPAVLDWVRAEAAHTRHTLDALPGHAALLRDLQAADQLRTPWFASVQRTAAGHWFYLMREPGAKVARLYLREPGADAPRVLLDPAAWEAATGQSHAINNFSVSPDGRHLAVVVAQGDAELGELRVIEVASGRAVRPPVPGIWGELSASWLPDGRSLLYARGADAGTPGGQAFGKMQLRRRFLDEQPDQPWLGHGQPFGPEVGEADWVWVDAQGGASHVVAFLVEGVSGNLRAWRTERDSLLSDPAGARWERMIEAADQIREAVVHGRWLYALSYQDAGRYRLQRHDLDRTESLPRLVVPERDGVLEHPTAAADGLYFVERHGATSELWRLPHTDEPVAPVQVQLPFNGAVTLHDAQPDVPGAVFTLEGWTRPQRLLQALEDRSLEPGLFATAPSPVGHDWVSLEASCPTPDGEQVPMSVLHRRDLPRDSQRPTILDGYGGYGVSEPAYFNPRLDAFLRRGGVWVDVKPRGGGAKGRDWYQAGAGPTKANTWRDMIACAQAVIRRGYTQPARLAITGTSMGGVAAGRAITERPDLFAAALLNVGILDAVRFVEATSNGPNHLLEMGDPSTPEGTRQLLAMSTYHQIRDGQRYPAVLLSTGLNDQRVAPWQSYKTFARLRAATRPGPAVLLRVDDAGHGVTATAEASRNANS